MKQTFTAKTGLLLDPYFSGTKVAWLLDHVKGAREKAERGELAFGTIDSFLIWRLTGGKVHATDATNASRTLLYNIHTGQWDDELLRILNIPASLLPEVKDCAADYGVTDKKLFGAAIPIGGVAGDQQAATIGQACFKPGMMKSTYGTGCFAILNTGDRAVTSHNRLLTTVAYQLNGKRTYALEGAIFMAGAAVQWLRDGLKLVKRASETGPLANAADDKQQVYLVPAFVGLGAPYWNAEARGALFGLTRGTTNKEIAKAALEAVCYQTRDLLEAMKKDWGSAGDTVLRVDGGMTASDWTMQCLADILDAPVDRPKVLETTAVGAAYLAGCKRACCHRQKSLRHRGNVTSALRQNETSIARSEICGLERRREKAVGLMRQSEFVALRDLSARLGADPLLVQAAGGNTSLKQDGVMWIKASGTWLMDALNKDIFVPLDMAALAKALGDDSPDCEAACLLCART